MISQIINEFPFELEHIRDSSKLKLLLRDIADSINDNMSVYWNKQNGKVRLDAIMKLLTSQLCIPHLLSFLGVGSNYLSKSGKNQSPNNDSVTDMDTSFDDDYVIDENDLTLVERAKYILIEALSLFKINEVIIASKGIELLFFIIHFK